MGNYSAYVIGVTITVIFVAFIDWIKVIYKNKYSDNFVKKEKEEMIKFKKKNEEFFKGDSMKRDYYIENTLEELNSNYHTAYRKGEFIFILFLTFIFLIFVLFLAVKFGHLLHLDFYNKFYLHETTNITTNILNSLVIFCINLVLYSGLLIQLIVGYEELPSRPPFFMFMEYIYGPFLEEMLYRGILFNIFHLSGFSSVQSGLVSSLMFGLSHLRHFFDFDYHKGKLPMILFQVIYTTLFGFYTTYAYSYSGSIIAPIILHMSCNVLQLPRLNYLHDENAKKYKQLFSSAYIIGIIGFIFLVYRYH